MPWQVLVVGSDCADPSVTLTCDATEIAAFLSQHDGSAPLLVISTYDSLPRLAEGARLADTPIDLCVFDEARTAHASNYARHAPRINACVRGAHCVGFVVRRRTSWPGATASTASGWTMPRWPCAAASS